MVSINNSIFNPVPPEFKKLSSEKDITYRELVNQINHEFVTKEHGRPSKHVNNFIIALKDFGDRVVTNFLARFNELGNFSIRMEIDYRIYKNDMFDDFCTLKHSDVLRFEVINPFIRKFDIYSDCYMSIQKQKIYPLGKTIKLAMIFNSCLDSEIEFKKIKLSPFSNDIILDCTLAMLLDEQADQFFVQQGPEYIINLTSVLNNEFSGNLGKMEILWSDTKLKEFDEELSNSTEFILPELDAKQYDINLNYSIGKEITLKKPIELTINVTNTSSEFKKISFLIDHSPAFVLSGLVKKRLILYPQENKSINISMIPLAYGKLKLPPFKIMEYPLIGSTSDNKINSIYTLPDYILVKGTY
jgi:hypothetical protein